MQDGPTGSTCMHLVHITITITTMQEVYSDIISNKKKLTGQSLYAATKSW